MHVYTLMLHPDPDQVFADGAFDGCVGKTLDIKDEDGNLVAEGTVVTADVRTGGGAVGFTFELSDDSPLARVIRGTP